MSIDLEKRAEKVRIILEKKQIRNVPQMRAGAALDISGSARPLYQNRIIQQTLDRILPIALRFDDNGELDMWTFHNAFQRLPVATRNNFEGYVEREILNKSSVSKWGGTSYAPIMTDIDDLYFGANAKPAKSFLGSLFGKKETASASSLPAMCMFVTDGANDDRKQAAELMRRAKQHPIYWNLIGVGDPREFAFLRDMADELPNVGFVHLPRLDIPEDDLYEQLLSDELCGWIRAR